MLVIANSEQDPQIQPPNDFFNFLATLKNLYHLNFKNKTAFQLK